jgi:hypothetical protein
MNYRSKDKLAEALKKGLLEKREQKAQPAPSTPINIVEEQSRFEESQAKPTSKDINLVADALKPKRQPWAQKLWEENKPAPKPVAAPAPEKKKITLESMKESVAGLNPSIDPNKKPIKAEVLAENISEITSSLTAQNRTRYKPAKRETLEEKVARLEEQLSKKKLVEAEQLNEFKKGEDIGKPGLNFKKVAAKAAKEYGSKAAGKRVAGAVLQKILHKEEVEQLDELKASTLGRYIRKAQKDASVLPQKIEAEKEGDRHWPEPYKHGPKLQRKLNNRNIGMDRAEKALDRKDQKLKEDVEQLDELSADTLTKYGDRAWRSKANAHIDRGGADYLDDDKARSKATKTIGKRERGLALAKAMMKKKDC